MSRAFLREVHVEVGAGARGGERAQVDMDTQRHVDNGASLSRTRPRSLATLVTPTTSIAVQDNISPISLLCSILHQLIWAGARSNKFTGWLTDLAGLKRRH
jgi:hypothetical protein